MVRRIVADTHFTDLKRPFKACKAGDNPVSLGYEPTHQARVPEYLTL